MAEALTAAFGNRYELRAHLGKGAFGSVIQALDRRLNRRVAIKASRARSTDPDRLLREARSLAQLSHPGIVAVFDVAVAGEYCFVVSELLAGPNLSDWLEGRRPGVSESVQIVVQVADALAHAHSRSIVHRDVKPSNIVLAEDRRPVLVDFGLALTDLDAAGERGVVSGTPAYMSPEQVSGRGHRPDGRTDVYGLAATLYAMLSGRHPFRGHTSAEVMRQVQEDEPQPLRQLRPDVSIELEAVCNKGMAKLPADRFTTANDFAEALRRTLGLIPAAPAASSPPAPVPTRPATAAAPPPPPRSARTERRQVTLLHCTCEVAHGVEDDTMEELAAFQAICSAETTAHGGMPLVTAGETFLACFGYPVAREDATRQAVQAGLGICLRSEGAAVVAAVGTGPAVMTGSPNETPVVVGDVMTAVSAIAAQSSQPGVSVTGTAHRLIEDFFECEPCGEVRPRGAPSAVPVFRVKSERAVRSRIEAVDPARLTPLIGRDREVALLRERWELAAEGVRGVILLVADPGLGKSRLVRVIRDRVLSDGGVNPADSAASALTSANVVEWYCSPYHQASPFYPVTDYFDRAYQIHRGAAPAEQLDRLITRLRDDGVHEPEDQALLAAMLSIPAAGRLPELSLTPERQKEKTQDALLAWLTARAESTPVLFVVEDLHWIDPSTESLLARFVEHGGEASVLGLFTFRPEYEPPWKGKALQTQVALNRLTRSQIGEFMRAQTGTEAIPQAVIDQIVERTDGVPLFVEEFTRLMSESSGGAADLGTAIPTSLQDLLLARLDRMASVRDVVQLGAVIGRTFSYPVMRAACGLDESLLQVELEKLVGSGLLFTRGSPPRSTYTFKHALIQDAAYQSMVKKQRQQFHRTVAESLEESFPAVVETQPELLAHHFTEAGQSRRGVDYWLAAGQRARERSAHREAIRHFNRGLEVLATLPESGERDRLELRLQIPLSTATTMACGWGYPGLQAIQDRARALCDRIGRDAPTFAVTWGQWAWRALRAELDIANNIAADLVNQAKTLDDGYRMEACFPVSCTTLFRGEFERNMTHSPRGLALYDAERCRSHAQYTGQNAFCGISAFYSWSLALCGYPDQAVRVAEESIRLSQDTRDKYSEEFGRYHLGCIQQHFRLGSAARASGETVVAIGTEQGFATWVALGTLCRGAGLVIEGVEIQKGLDVLDAGIASFKAAGAELGLSNYLAIAAEGYRMIGRPDRAWAFLNDAFVMVERTAERFQLSNLHRICGDLLLDRATPEDTAAAHVEYQRAIEIARDQKARSWELRATTCLCRLWKSRGRSDEARAALESRYGGLTEGLQNPDMLEARALLDELS